MCKNIRLFFRWGEISSEIRYIVGTNTIFRKETVMAKKKKKTDSAPKYDPMEYVSAAAVPAAPVTYSPGTYNSQYQGQLNSALDKVTNWEYDPLQDASYQALAKIYGARGNIAAKDSLADAAALNGGYGTSYAVSAAQQARNQYNQELAGYIPDLENAAYNRATGALSALRDADDTAYGRFRDSELDNQWAYQQNYQKYQDALSQYQWARGFNLDIYQQKLAEQAAKGSGGGGSGGGGRRRSGGGYSGGYSGGSSTNSGGLTADALLSAAKKKTTTSSNPNSVMAYQTSKKKKSTVTNYPKK